MFRRAVVLLAVSWATVAVRGAYEPYALELNNPAIAYQTAARTDPVAFLNERLQTGDARLTFDERTGYLRSLLEQLDIPVESQTVVFSKTSLQSPIIAPSNPRSIFFNDSVAVGWMRSGFIEVAAHDAQGGTGFYLLRQTPVPAPQLLRDQRCLSCHNTGIAEGVPGFLLRSVPTATDGSLLPWLGNASMDHRTPLSERWGGWYVTGRVTGQHLGNVVIADRRAQALPSASPTTLTTLAGRFDVDAYLSPHSDVVALLVFEHQARALNLLTRTNWLTRLAAADPAASAALEATVNELVDYLLFVDEAPLHGVSGSSGYAQRFSAAGLRDRKGRSLRDLDLTDWLMRYPCSYLVYSPAFDGLSESTREGVYRRMKAILSGEQRAPRYARAAANGRAVLEILRETKKNLPEWF